MRIDPPAQSALKRLDAPGKVIGGDGQPVDLRLDGGKRIFCRAIGQTLNISNLLFHAGELLFDCRKPGIRPGGARLDSTLKRCEPLAQIGQGLRTFGLGNAGVLFGERSFDLRNFFVQRRKFTSIGPA